MTDSDPNRGFEHRAGLTTVWHPNALTPLDPTARSTGSHRVCQAEKKTDSPAPVVGQGRNTSRDRTLPLKITKMRSDLL